MGVVISIGLLVSLGVPTYAQESSIPSWIKSIAGFWSEGQISDDEFVSALQYLVENGVLTIPEKQNVSKSPPKETTKTETTQNEYQPKLEALYVEGDHVNILTSIVDKNGNPVSLNGEIVLKVIEDSVHEIFTDKKYFVPQSFTEYTNAVSGEKTKGMRWSITLDELKSGGAHPDIVVDRMRGDFIDQYSNKIAPNTDHPDIVVDRMKGNIVDLYYTEITLKMILTIRDEVFENEIELRHLPIHEGFFNKDTGFVDMTTINQSLDLGPFHITALEGGSYKDDNVVERVTEFYRINLKTQFKSSSDVSYIINEIFIIDEKNNLYLVDPESKIDSNDILEGKFSHVLFENIPQDATTAKLTIRISEVETDISEKHYEDTIEFSLR